MGRPVRRSPAPDRGPGFPAALLATARTNIAAHRIHITAVGGDADHLPFAYTAGLTPFYLPELWCSALGGLAQVGAVLNAAAAAAFDAVEDGGLREGLLELDYSVPFKVRHVRTDAARVNLTRALYPHAVLLVSQVLWPDVDGRYPDERAYDRARFPQDLLPLHRSSVPG